MAKHCPSCSCDHIPEDYLKHWRPGSHPPIPPRIAPVERIQNEQRLWETQRDE